jgi:hypothetical protein
MRSRGAYPSNGTPMAFMSWCSLTGEKPDRQTRALVDLESRDAEGLCAGG